MKLVYNKNKESQTQLTKNEPELQQHEVLTGHVEDEEKTVKCLSTSPELQSSQDTCSPTVEEKAHRKSQDVGFLDGQEAEESLTVEEMIKRNRYYEDEEDEEEGGGNSLTICVINPFQLFTWKG